MKIFKISLACIVSLLFVYVHTADAAVLSALSGTYQYVDGYKIGEVELTKHKDKLVIQLNTVTPHNYHTCEYQGICAEHKGKIICLNEDFNDDKDLYIIITPIDNKTISLSSPAENNYCGNDAYFTGKYVKK